MSEDKKCWECGVVLEGGVTSFCSVSCRHDYSGVDDEDYREESDLSCDDGFEGFAIGE